MKKVDKSSWSYRKKTPNEREQTKPIFWSSFEKANSGYNVEPPITNALAKKQLEDFQIDLEEFGEFEEFGESDLLW